jgi:hypothetical protein
VLVRVKLLQVIKMSLRHANSSSSKNTTETLTIREATKETKVARKKMTNTLMDKELDAKHNEY